MKRKTTRLARGMKWGSPERTPREFPPTGLIRQERSQRQVAETERVALQHLAPGWEKYSLFRFFHQPYLR